MTTSTAIIQVIRALQFFQLFEHGNYLSNSNCEVNLIYLGPVNRVRVSDYSLLEIFELFELLGLSCATL